MTQDASSKFAGGVFFDSLATNTGCIKLMAGKAVFGFCVRTCFQIANLYPIALVLQLQGTKFTLSAWVCIAWAGFLLE